jgi:UrcA family protein
MMLLKKPRSRFVDSMRAALLTLPTLLAASLSQANTFDGDAPKYVLRYYPDSLSTPDGWEVLKRRIVHAAELVCGTPRLALDLSVRAEYDNCVREATDRALTEVEEQRRAQVEARK